MHRLSMGGKHNDCAVVLIGHLNKKENSKGLYRSLGIMYLYEEEGNKRNGGF